jgi:hypothetical protein
MQGEMDGEFPPYATYLMASIAAYEKLGLPWLGAAHPSLLTNVIECQKRETIEEIPLDKRAFTIFEDGLRNLEHWFMFNAKFPEAQKNVLAGYSVNLNDVLQHLVASMYQYDRWGRNTYVLGPNMQELFLRTSLEGLSIKDLAFPYPTIYVATPGCELTMYDGPTGEPTLGRLGLGEDLPIEGFYISMEAMPLGQVAGAQVAVKPWQEHLSGPTTALTWLTITAITNKGDPRAASANKKFGIFGGHYGSACFYSSFFNASEDIEEIVADIDQTLERAGCFALDERGLGSRFPANRRNQMKLTIWGLKKLALNMVAYINSMEPEIRTTKTRSNPEGATPPDTTTRSGRREDARRLKRLFAERTTIHIGEQLEREMAKRRRADPDFFRNGGSRCAHWRNVRIGPMKNPDGSWVPKEERDTKKVLIAATIVEPSGKGKMVEGHDYIFTEETRAKNN